ncbi:MAG TPA: transposase [Arthrobacter sp.]|nr:transposase [Arthrobacter sp.]
MMGGRYDMTDFEWSAIGPLLPNKPRGVPRVDDRRVLNGILWRFRTGAPWRDVPERYGPRTTALYQLALSLTHGVDSQDGGGVIHHGEPAGVLHGGSN